MVITKAVPIVYAKRIAERVFETIEGGSIRSRRQCSNPGCPCSQLSSPVIVDWSAWEHLLEASVRHTEAGRAKLRRPVSRGNIRAPESRDA